MRLMNRDGSWAEPEQMGEWQQQYDFWTSELWTCPKCEETPYNGPFEDSGVCENCA